MADQRLPYLRGAMSQQQEFQNPRGYRPPKPLLPSRDPSSHGQSLLAQLDDLALEVAAKRHPGDDGAGASRAIVAVEPAEGYRLNAAEMGSLSGDARVLYEDKTTGRVVVDAADPNLPHLRKKIAKYADDDKLTRSGNRASDGAIAPVARVLHATLEELAGERLRDALVAEEEPHWFEVTCRGGIRALIDTADSRRRVTQVLAQFGLRLNEAQVFIATEAVVFYVRLTMPQLRQLVEAGEYVLEVELVEVALRDWATLLVPSTRALDRFVLTPPDIFAPSVVLLDSGIATRHPLLQDAILRADSALVQGPIPQEASPEDHSDHGTGMAGVALYDDLAEALRVNQTHASHWIQSVKLLNHRSQGIADEVNRPFWPAITQIGVQQAELDYYSDRPRVFVMAVSAKLDRPSSGTTWSHALDQLAYNQGRGRLLCVSAGNAPVDEPNHLHGYPRSCLQTTLDDPAQASNALTIGAYTKKTTLPPELASTRQRARAPEGGISPYTRSGAPGCPIKPDVVFEGGNVAFDGQVPNAGVETLSALTTSRRFSIDRPLSSICATSEATAHAGRFAAQLWAASPELRPETVRGLVVHAASWTPAMLRQFPALDDRLAACGYGAPDLELAIACAADRATVIIEDRMPNRVEERVLRQPPPKRPSTDPYESKWTRVAKYFRLPLPLGELMHAGDLEAELRVTLSYFAEPNTFRRKVARGLDLRWDMQGPAERADAFMARINKLARGVDLELGVGSFRWEVGPMRRQRGTVQSDRWIGPAVDLADMAEGKLIAVYPVGGWWDQRERLSVEEMPFTLIVTVRAQGLPLYELLLDALALTVSVDGGF